MRTYNYSVAFDHKKRETIPYLEIQYRNRIDVIVPAVIAGIISFFVYIVIGLFTESLYMKLLSFFVFIIIFGISAKAFTVMNPETKTAKGKEFIVRSLKKEKVILLDNNKIGLEKSNAKMRKIKIGGGFY